MCRAGGWRCEETMRRRRAGTSGEDGWRMVEASPSGRTSTAPVTMGTRPACSGVRCATSGRAAYSEPPSPFSLMCARRKPPGFVVSDDTPTDGYRSLLLLRFSSKLDLRRAIAWVSGGTSARCRSRATSVVSCHMVAGLLQAMDSSARTHDTLPIYRPPSSDPSSWKMSPLSWSWELGEGRFRILGLLSKSRHRAHTESQVRDPMNTPVHAAVRHMGCHRHTQDPPIFAAVALST